MELIYYIQTDKQPVQQIGPFNDAETAQTFIEKHMMGFNAPASVVNKE